MPFIYPDTDAPSLAGRTLVVPIVSTANVAQLAVDLIISTLSLKRVATLDPSFCIPVVGAREDGLPGVTTPLELFGKPDINVVVLQQRSPVLTSRKQEYVEALLELIKTSQLSAVLFLSGVDLSNRADSQMFTPTYQIPVGPSLKGSTLETLQTYLEQGIIPSYTQSPAQLEGKADDSIPFVPGGGLTCRVLSSIPQQDWTTPTGALLQFVLEGDNRADATLLASVVARILNLNSHIAGGQWRPPASWSVGLFGSPHDQDLYG